MMTPTQNTISNSQGTECGLTCKNHITSRDKGAERRGYEALKRFFQVCKLNLRDIGGKEVSQTSLKQGWPSVANRGLLGGAGVTNAVDIKEKEKEFAAKGKRLRMHQGSHLGENTICWSLSLFHISLADGIAWTRA